MLSSPLFIEMKWNANGFSNWFYFLGNMSSWAPLFLWFHRIFVLCHKRWCCEWRKEISKMWYGIWDDQAFGLRAVWSLFGIFAPIHLLLSFSALNLPPIHFQLKLLPILSFFGCETRLFCASTIWSWYHIFKYYKFQV